MKTSFQPSYLCWVILFYFFCFVSPFPILCYLHALAATTQRFMIAWACVCLCTGTIANAIKRNQRKKITIKLNRNLTIQCLKATKWYDCDAKKSTENKQSVQRHSNKTKNNNRQIKEAIECRTYLRRNWWTKKSIQRTYKKKDKLFVSLSSSSFPSYFFIYIVNDWVLFAFVFARAWLRNDSIAFSVSLYIYCYWIYYFTLLNGLLEFFSTWYKSKNWWR